MTKDLRGGKTSCRRDSCPGPRYEGIYIVTVSARIKHRLIMLNTARPLNPHNLAAHQGLVLMKLQAAPGAGVMASLSLAGKPIETQKNVPGAPKATATYELIVTGPPNPALPPSWVSFTRWWEELVIKTSDRTTFTRKQLVLTMTNQDGGAHVDPELCADYARLTKFNSQGWGIETSGITVAPDNSIADSSVRQIAHELERSILESFWNDDGGLAPFL